VIKYIFKALDLLEESGKDFMEFIHVNLFEISNLQVLNGTLIIRNRLIQRDPNKIYPQ